jgi:hypothetical protein
MCARLGERSRMAPEPSLSTHQRYGATEGLASLAACERGTERNQLFNLVHYLR